MRSTDIIQSSVLGGMKDILSEHHRIHTQGLLRAGGGRALLLLTEAFVEYVRLQSIAFLGGANEAR